MDPTPIEDVLDVALGRAIRSMRAELTRLVLDLQMEDNGRVLSDSVALSRVDSAIRNLAAIMERSGLDDYLKKQSSELLRIADGISADYKSLGMDSTYGESSQRAIRMLVEGADAGILAIADQARVQVADFLRRAVLGGGDRGSLLAEIQAVMDTTEARARTLAMTSLHAFNRQVTVRHADDIGVKEFAYVGPDDSVTREWCSHWVDRRGTAAQFESTAQDWGHDKQPGPVMVWGGGWNCRHRFIPLVDEESKQEFEEGPS